MQQKRAALQNAMRCWVSIGGDKGDEDERTDLEGWLGKRGKGNQGKTKASEAGGSGERWMMGFDGLKSEGGGGRTCS